MTAPANDPAAIFAAAFNRLRARFGMVTHTPEAVQVANDYYAYLSGVLSLDEMLTAMGGLWATREFFPKPADFVLAFAPAEWAHVQHAMDHWNDNGGHDRAALLAPLSARAKAACHALGGVGSMRDETGGVVRMKREWERCYADAVQAEAMTMPIMPEMRALPGKRRELAAGRKLIGSANP